MKTNAARLLDTEGVPLRATKGRVGAISKPKE